MPPGSCAAQGKTRGKAGDGLRGEIDVYKRQVQGFVFAKPMPLADFERRLKSED